MPSKRGYGRHALVLLLGLSAAAAFSPVLGGGFVFDDARYILANRHVRNGLSPDGLHWALTSLELANWHPLTWLSHMLDAGIYGLRPSGHHLTSLLLHLANASLVFLFLAGATGARGRSAAAAALWSLHPLRVESVAWVAERKDVLSAFLGLLSLLGYVAWTRRPSPGKYLLALATFALGLMAKSMLVSLPFVLLLLDFWPLGRMGTGTVPPRSTEPVPRLLLEKLPFFLLAAASSAVTLVAQAGGGAVRPLESYPAAVRLGNAVTAWAGYLKATFWPSGLAAFYPHPGRGLSWPAAALSAATLILVSVLLARRARREPYLAGGWFVWLVTLIPVIGLVQVGDQAMADRYTYIPSIGLAVAAVWGVDSLQRRRPAAARGLVLLFPVLAAVLGALTFRQAGFWKSDETLAARALAVTDGNYLAANAMGAVLLGRGEARAAAEHFEAALRLRPAYAEARVNLALALSRLGNPALAEEQFRQALLAGPGRAATLGRYGTFLMTRRRYEEALPLLRRAAAADPDRAEPRNSLGSLLAVMGRPEEAAPLFTEAVRLDPENAEARYNLSRALISLGRFEEGARHYREAVRLKPSLRARTYLRLAEKLHRAGRYGEAVGRYREALRADAGDAEALLGLGRAYLDMGDREAAIEVQETLRSISPELAAKLPDRSASGRK